jgi:hypothetical protein
LIIYLAFTRFLRVPLENSAGVPWRRIEWKIRNIGNAAVGVPEDALEGIRRGIKGALR